MFGAETSKSQKTEREQEAAGASPVTVSAIKSDNLSN